MLTKDYIRDVVDETIINALGIKTKEGSMDSERALFAIRAINKDTDEVVFSAEVVAEGEKEALYNSNLKETLKEKKLKKEDVNLIITEIGKLPPKETVKNVKILGQLGSHILAKELEN